MLLKKYKVRTMKQTTRLNRINDFIKDIILPIVCAILITQFICVIAVVPTASMKPLINEGDKLFVNKIQKVYKDISRGDLLVFNAPKDISSQKKLLIKRVVGLPGETVEIKNGQVFINEKPIEENYVVYPDNRSVEKFTIPEGEYFLLGDNRNNSFDCRFWNKKTINEDDIVGFAYTFNLFKNKD